MKIDENVIARYWARAVPGEYESDCWGWTGSATHYADFIVMVDGRLTNPKAHRIAWMIHNDATEIPDGMYVLHNCQFLADNKTCTNPGHLYLGTAKENAIDRRRKERRAKILAAGTGMHISFCGRAA